MTVTASAIANEEWRMSFKYAKGRQKAEIKKKMRKCRMMADMN